MDLQSASLAIIFPSFLVTFRETFEAILLMVILISYLKKTDKVFLIKPVIKPAYMGGCFGLHNHL